MAYSHQIIDMIHDSSMLDQAQYMARTINDSNTINKDGCFVFIGSF